MILAGFGLRLIPLLDTMMRRHGGCGG